MPRKIPDAPSWLEVILGAVLSFVLGVTLAATYLVLKPVVTVKQMPKEADIDPRAVYFIEGSHDSSRARDASSKRAQFIQGKSVSLNEDEINLLVAPNAPSTKPAPLPAKKKPGEVVPDLNAEAKIAPPNFRIRNNQVQIAIPVKASAFGLEGNVVVLARGTFVRDGNVFVFDPESMTVGSCSLDRLPIIFGFVYRKFIGSQPIPQDIAAAWGKLTAVHVEGETLKLSMP
jgi:hypothetical protein